MPSFDHLVSFFLATLLFAIIPGPAILYMTAQTMAHGRKAGMLAALGIHIGFYAHIIAATIGLAALLQHLPGFYLTIKMTGAAYLIWLGIRMLFDCPTETDGAARSAAGHATLRESIIVQMLNPTTAAFFLAFLPQFVDPAAALPVGPQFLILGVIVNLVLSMGYLTAVVIASLARGHLVRSCHGSRVLFTACGSILIGLGGILAVQSL